MERQPGGGLACAGGPEEEGPAGSLVWRLTDGLRLKYGPKTRRTITGAVWGRRGTSDCDTGVAPALTCYFGRTDGVGWWRAGSAPDTPIIYWTGLRIRRLGVRIPSGALCVETDDGPPTSGNAVGGLLVPGIRTGVLRGLGPKMGPKIRGGVLGSPGVTLGS